MPIWKGTDVSSPNVRVVFVNKKLQLGNSAADTARGWKTRFTLDFGEDTNRPYIPCYAARKELGLCNSSAAGEKANDLIVSERQKHNGMSWAKKGTVALATITALAQNNEYKKWFEEKDIDFKLAA